MAKETVEKECEVVQTVEETLWRCDDCQREFDEEELVPVAVGPEVEEIGWLALSRKLRERLYQTTLLKRDVEKCQESLGSTSKDAVKTVEELESACLDVGGDILDEMDDARTYTAASVLDVCEECLEDDFGITVEEHDGRLFEERNYEETVEKAGLHPWEKGVLSLVFMLGLLIIAALVDAGATPTSILPISGTLAVVFYFVLPS